MMSQKRRDHITDELKDEWSVDLENTLSNLRGEGEKGNLLAEDDYNAVIHHRWRWEVENPGEYLPEHLEVKCPHCGSPEIEDEHGNVYPTEVEDRLSTYDRDGNPRPGVVVERHLIDGDVAIFNRQPSLHRMSMLVHEIRVMQGKTFRFNLADCTPYNADFDGDEMNLHVIQSEEARAEARILMRVQEHIISPRYGGSVIGGIHDHISGAYLLTHGGGFLPKHVVLEVLSSVDWDGNLPEEIKENGKVGFRGNDVFSLLVSEGFSLNFKNRAGESVNVSKGDVSGTIDKRGIGAEDGRLLDAVVQTHGTDIGADFINKMTKMTIAICTAMGFTTGIDDEDLPPEAMSEIAEINRAASAKVDSELEKFGKDGKKYESRPGRTPLETLEENILTILDEGKAETGNVAKSLLGEENSAVLMATSGARGSMDNLAMMAGSIGQPKVRGKRLERGYQDRVLSHFPRKVKGAKEKGFVSSSFKSGLEPTEFFMLSVSGRESLVDTAVRTSKSGYMQRRLINAMDDLKVSSDDKASVRNTANRIIQFEYGEDGIDPARSRKGSPFDVDQVLDDALGGGN
jgi:DNA-directed RNA polymerase subunit A'